MRISNPSLQENDTIFLPSEKKVKGVQTIQIKKIEGDMATVCAGQETVQMKVADLLDLKGGVHKAA